MRQKRFSRKDAKNAKKHEDRPLTLRMSPSSPKSMARVGAIFLGISAFLAAWRDNRLQDRSLDEGSGRIRCNPHARQASGRRSIRSTNPVLTSSWRHSIMDCGFRIADSRNYAARGHYSLAQGGRFPPTCTEAFNRPRGSRQGLSEFLANRSHSCARAASSKESRLTWPVGN